MAVLKMQRLGLCALKKNRKEILELLQRRGVLDIDTDAAEDEVFQRTDTSKERADFEKEIQLAEHALEILQRYVPEHKGMLSSLEGKKLVDLESCRRMEAARETVLHKARKIEELSREAAECETESRKLENEREALEPWKALAVPMDFAGTKWTAALIGTFPGVLSTEQLCEVVEAALARDAGEGTADGPAASGAPEHPGYYAEVVSADADQSCVFILVKKEDAGRLEEALRTEGFARPSRTEGTRPAVRQEELSRELEALKEKKEALEEQIRAFAESREELKLAADYYRMRLEGSPGGADPGLRGKPGGTETGGGLLPDAPGEV